MSRSDISVSMRFTAEDEPWIFCTSFAPTQSFGEGSMEELKKEFEKSKGVDAHTTAIDDPDQFAKQLGIEAALKIKDGHEFKSNYGKHVVDMNFGTLICDLEALPLADALIWINHGPVHYEDKEPEIKTVQDMPMMESLRACFTKREEFAGQREYRFAISIAGRTLKDVVYLDATRELLNGLRNL